MPITFNTANNLKLSGDWQAERDAAAARKQGLESNALSLQINQMSMADRKRAAEEEGVIRNTLAGLGPDADVPTRIKALESTNTKTGYAAADTLRKTAAETAQKEAAAKASLAAAGHSEAQTGEVRRKAVLDAMKNSAAFVFANPTPENARRAILQMALDHGGDPSAELSQLAQLTTPEQVKKWAQGHAMTAEQQSQAADREAARMKPNPQEMRLGDRIVVVDTNPLSATYKQEITSAKVGQSPDNKASNERMAADSAAARKQSSAQFDATQKRLRESASAGGGAPRTGQMSVTLQKELLESDDVVQSAASVIRSLQTAKTKNDTAYSGYAAKGRATLASNLGGSEAADATIDIDNLMTGQGLDSLKSIFGAAPTEGERKILMDMQASVDKTPTQRAAIMDRAISAAQRRMKFATKKAEAIRSGTYLTEGVPLPVDDINPPPPGLPDMSAIDAEIARRGKR